MPRLAATTSPADRRCVIVLRVPGHELACSLPGNLEPLTVAGQGLVLLDYAQRTRPRLGGLLGGPEHHLALRVPARSSCGDGARVLWVPRRYTSSAVAALGYGRNGRGTRALRASFDLGVNGFHLELEVRTARGRVLYVRAETCGDLGRSLFRRPDEVEALLQEWSLAYRPAGWCSGLDRPAVPTSTATLQPLLVHALQDATLPELFPGIEDAVELDCALRQVGERTSPIRVQRPGLLRHLARPDLDAPPAGAFMDGARG